MFRVTVACDYIRDKSLPLKENIFLSVLFIPNSQVTPYTMQLRIVVFLSGQSNRFPIVLKS